ncbi:MAG TPA: hypothetical protein PK239_13605, partial [Chitinophagales bacterium]|nr:hypothetical protein [Chitinophagales bacterium]
YWNNIITKSGKTGCGMRVRPKHRVSSYFFLSKNSKKKPQLSFYVSLFLHQQDDAKITILSSLVLQNKKTIS